ncbi:MAG: hypothetical protein ACOC92_00420 [bacterium]
MPGPDAPEDAGSPARPEAAESPPAEPEEPLPEASSEPGAGDGEAGDAEESPSDGDPADEDADEIRIERGSSVERDDSVILIERGGRSAPSSSLYEAARKAREERARTGPSRVTVDDENLHEFQGDSLTFAEPAAEEEGQEEAAADGEPEGSDDTGGGGSKGAETEEAASPGAEEYWRSRLLDLRLRLREAVDELDELQERAGSLRRSFYAQDDPYVRDGRIKPAWDRVLDRIGETRSRIGTLREELQQAVQEGRRAGALPGWLREGIELEPAPEELPAEEGEGEPGRHRPEDPRGVEEEQEPPG